MKNSKNILRDLFYIAIIMIGCISLNGQDYPNLNDESFYWENGYGEKVKVGFLITDDVKISKKVLSSIIYKSMFEAKYSLKYKLSFVPKKAFVTKIDEKLAVVIDCYGKNAYGAEDLVYSYHYFTTSGEYIRSI
jgi:hypothetical protein